MINLLKFKFSLITLGLVALLLIFPGIADADASYYQYRRFHSNDGIGKFYCGREIAKVMGHQAMLWLERPSRADQEQPSRAIAALHLQPTDTVVDLGAGTGYFSFPMATLVPQGKVLAVDIQPEMLDVINFLSQENQVPNLETIQATETDPRLPPEAVDLVLMVDAYHEFSYPHEIMTAVVKSLKPQGRVALLEYRGENPLIPIKALHKMRETQVKREMAEVGLTWQETIESLPQQHLIVFKLP